MSWWTDIRDVVAAPVTTTFNILTTPFVALADIIEGKNVGDTIKSSIQRDIGGALDANIPSFALARTEAGQGILRNKITDKLTFGYSTDAAGASESAKKLEEGKDLSSAETVELGRFGLKSAIAVGAGVGAAAAGASTGTAVTVYGAGQGVAAKNYFGAAAGLAGGLGIGEDLAGSGVGLDDLINRLGPKPTAPARRAPGQSGYPLSTQSGFDDGLESGGSPLFLVAGVGVLGFLVLKKLRKI